MKKAQRLQQSDHGHTDVLLRVTLVCDRGVGARSQACLAFRGMVTASSSGPRRVTEVDLQRCPFRFVVGGSAIPAVFLLKSFFRN